MDTSAEEAEGERTAAARSSVVPALAATVGTAALVVLVIVMITGGFTVDAGPLHVSAHNWRGPLLIALLALALVALPPAVLHSQKRPPLRGRLSTGTASPSASSLPQPQPGWASPTGRIRPRAPTRRVT